MYLCMMYVHMVVKLFQISVHLYDLKQDEIQYNHTKYNLHFEENLHDWLSVIVTSIYCSKQQYIFSY